MFANETVEGLDCLGEWGVVGSGAAGGSSERGPCFDGGGVMRVESGSIGVGSPSTNRGAPSFIEVGDVGDAAFAVRPNDGKRKTELCRAPSKLARVRG